MQINTSMDNIIEKYSELKEELNGKNPFVKYSLLKAELDNKDPLKRYSQIKEELDYIKEENARKFEEDEKKREENALGAMESLFHSFGGEESDVENQPIVVDEQPQELISEEEIVLSESDITEEKTTVSQALEVITKQEKNKEEKVKEESNPIQVKINRLEHQIKQLFLDKSALGGGLDPNKISAHLIPTTANTYDLGSSDRPWKDVHLSGATLVIGGTELASSELTVLDNVTAGTISASKAVIVDSNKDITGFRNVSAVGTITGETLAGTLSTAAQGSVTSLGTLTALTVDDIIINGTNIGHTSDPDAIAIASSGNVTISQDLAVSGALTISGGTTKIESTVTTIVDPIIHLQTASGGGALGSDTNKDVGLALQYHTGSAAKTAFLGYDDSAGKLTFIPDASLSSEVVSGTTGTIVAALEGNSTTATTLANARTIGGTSFDGSSNIAVALSATTTALANARTIGGVSFDGTANINLPGVNASGNQDTSGNADTSTALATGRTIGMTGDVVWTSASFTGSGNVTGAATIQAGSVENSMLADDAVGADELASDAVVNSSVASGAAIALSKLATTTASRVLETSGTGAISASDITTTELAFLDGSTAGSVVNSKAVIYSGTGTIAGTLSTAAQGNVTSLGTLTTLTVDNVIINGTTIGHTGDTDLLTVASGILTVAGEVSMTTLDIGGTNVTSTAAELNRLDGIGSAVVGLTDSQTLTNKTLTSPVFNTGVSGTAVLDEDDLSSDSATKIATQQSIKAYVEATSTAMAIALG